MKKSCNNQPTRNKNKQKQETCETKIFFTFPFSINSAKQIYSDFHGIFYQDIQSFLRFLRVLLLSEFVFEFV